MLLHDDRLFPADPVTRGIARRIFATVRDLPIISPHGHTDPRWYAENNAFPDPATLFVKPDHYIFRMLYSQGVRLEQLGIPRKDGADYRAGAMWLTDAEFAAFLRDLAAVFQPRLANAPGKKRRRRMIYTAFLPAPEQPADTKKPGRGNSQPQRRERRNP